MSFSYWKKGDVYSYAPVSTYQPVTTITDAFKLYDITQYEVGTKKGGGAFSLIGPAYGGSITENISTQISNTTTNLAQMNYALQYAPETLIAYPYSDLKKSFGGAGGFDFYPTAMPYISTAQEAEQAAGGGMGGLVDFMPYILIGGVVLFIVSRYAGKPKKKVKKK